jgi:hypothetical protein
LNIEPEGRSIAVEWLGPQAGPKSFGPPGPADDDGGDTSGEPLVIHRFSSPIDSGSDSSAGDPNFYLEPANHGSAGDRFGQQPGPFSFGSPGWPADGGPGSTSPADPLTGDTPPESPIVLLGDSASLHRPPAPGTPPFYPSPGAGSLSDPPSDGTDTGSGDGGGGGRVLLPGAADGTPGSNGGAKSTGSRLSVDVMPIRSDEIQTEVMQKVTAMIEANVGQQIDQLRHETFVSRAAWNAALPR